MKIMLITKNLPPDVGGMETLWYEAIKELTKLCELTVVGPAAAQKKLAKICEFIPTPRPMALLLPTALIKGLFHNNTKKFDVICAGSGVTAPIALIIAKLKNTKSCVYLHGLDIIYRNILYQVAFASTFRHFDRVICNSSNTASLALDKGVLKSRATVVNPAVTNTFTAKAAQQIVQINPEKHNLVFLGRLVERKGLIPFIENCFKSLTQKDKTIHLHIIGSASSKASRNYLKTLNNIIQSSNLSDNITYHGKLDDHIAKGLVSKCEIHVLPAISIEGDIEGYGMTIIEAAEQGIRTVAFDQGGIGDAIARTNESILIHANDYDNFGKAILTLLRQGKRPSGGSLLKDPYHWNEFASQVIRAMECA